MSDLHLVDENLSNEWDELADRTGASPYQRPGWFVAWWSAFGAGRPLVLAARRGGRLVGVLPVARRRGGVSGLENWHTFTYGPVAENADAATDVLEQLLCTVRSRLDIGHLMPADLAAVEKLARERRFTVVSSGQQQSPYISIDRTFEEYGKRLDPRWLRQLERRRGRLDRQDGVRFTVLDGSKDLDGLLDEAFRIEALGWKGESGTAIVSSRDTHDFYRALGEWAAARGILRIGMLMLGDRAIAADIALEEGGVHYFLKTGFDPEYRSSAPGLILRHDMIERSFRLGHRSYELLGSAESYKLQWTDDVHQISQLIAFPPSVLGMAARAAWTGGRVQRRLQVLAGALNRPAPAAAEPQRAEVAAG